jgi:hypothetical protein
MEDRKKFEMNEQELETAAGGTETNSLLHGTGYYMTVQVEKNYLALRTYPEYNDSNEIARLYTGDQVEFVRKCDSTYIYVYDPKTGQYGYTNCNYLIDPQTGRRGVSNPLGF